MYEPLARAAQSCAEIKCNQAPKHKVIGYTKLSGVDFDFEQSSRLSETQNQQMAQLAQEVRAKVGKTKLIALTSYHVGADPLNCQDSNILENCSFTETARSIHHGEVLPLLNSSQEIFDFHNIMVYDAGRNYDFATAMFNYAKIIGDPKKLRIGVSINQQWGPHGGFVMPNSENISRMRWQQEHSFGGFFVWALGANTEARDLESQISMFNSFVDATKTDPKLSQ